MRKLMIILIVTVLAAGCTRGAGEYLEYTALPFITTIEGEIGELEFSAEVRVGVPATAKEEGAELPRDIEMLFLHPSTLCGIKITREAGVLTVSSGEVAAEGSVAAGWLEIAEQLIPDGSITGAKILTVEGIRQLRAELRLEEGGCQTIWVDCDTGYPMHIVSDTSGYKIDIRILTFCKTENNGA